jgi:hypothetical protein
MEKRIACAIVLALANACMNVSAEVAPGTGLHSDHVLIGTWRIELPTMMCFEEYEFRPDGTRLATSGQERMEADFFISTSPSEHGFYKWTDKITRTNGKPDCFGEITPSGHVATNYLRFASDGKSFLLCTSEDLNSCVAEFWRK